MKINKKGDIQLSDALGDTEIILHNSLIRGTLTANSPMKRVHILNKSLILKDLMISNQVQEEIKIEDSLLKGRVDIHDNKVFRCIGKITIKNTIFRGDLHINAMCDEPTVLANVKLHGKSKIAVTSSAQTSLLNITADNDLEYSFQFQHNVIVKDNIVDSLIIDLKSVGDLLVEDTTIQKDLLFTGNQAKSCTLKNVKCRMLYLVNNDYEKYHFNNLHVKTVLLSKDYPEDNEKIKLAFQTGACPIPQFVYL